MGIDVCEVVYVMLYVVWDIQWVAVDVISVYKTNATTNTSFNCRSDYRTPAMSGQSRTG